MRYHFGPELSVEPCSFGEHCPAKSHFDSEREASSTLESAQRMSKRSPTSPITGVDGKVLTLFLKTIANPNPRGVWPSNPAAPLEYNRSEEEIQRILQILTREGMLNAIHRTDVQFVDGVEKIKSSGILWKVEAKNSWDHHGRVSLHSALTLTKRGSEVLTHLTGQSDESSEAGRLITALETDGMALENFTEDLARLVDHRSEFQKRAGSKLPGQIQKLIDGTWGSNILWTRSDIAEKFGCSISSATDIATKLTTWGILQRTTRKSFYGPNLIAYRVVLGPLAVLGGVSELFKAAEQEQVAA